MSDAFRTNLTSPPLLCFFLGLFAALARSDLDIPNPVAPAASIYALFAIGFKGGVALAFRTPFGHTPGPFSEERFGRRIFRTNSPDTQTNIPRRRTNDEYSGHT